MAKERPNYKNVTGNRIQKWFYLLFIIIFQTGLKAQGDNFVIFSNKHTDVSTETFLELYDSIVANERLPQRSLQWIKMYEKFQSIKPAPEDLNNKVKIEKAKRYNELAWNENVLNFDLAFKYLDTAQFICDEITYEDGTWRNTYGLATIYKNMGQNDSSLYYFDQYLDHYLNPFDSFFVANVQFQRGVVFMQMGKYENASEALLNSVQLYEEMHESKSQANSLNSLANVYKRAKLNQKALEIYDQVKTLSLKNKDSMGYSIALINQGNLYSQIDSNLQASLNYEEALKFSPTNLMIQGYIYENWGNLLIGQSNFEEGLEKLQKSLRIRNNLGNPIQINNSKKSLGQAYYKMENYSSAEKYLLETYLYAVTNKDIETIEVVTNLLSRIYEANSQFGKALEFRNENQRTKDSLLDLSIATSISEANAKYETEKKQKEIILLKSENEIQNLKLQNRNFALIASILGILFLTLMLVWINRKRNQIIDLNIQLEEKNKLIKKSLEEKNVLLKEIHHRVKNNLQVISSLLNLQSRNLKDKGAIDALNLGRSRVQSMSLIHQNLYQHDDLKGQDLKNYFENLITSLFETYNISNDDIKIIREIETIILDVDTLIPIGLILNELITNALKHAFPNQKGEISVKIFESEEQLQIEVHDNGVGLTESQFTREASYGNDLIRALVQKLDGKLSIYNDEGTRFVITIQNYQKAA